MESKDIQFISYDGKWPNLCSGNLVFSVNGQKREVKYALCSGGGITQDWDTYSGAWSIIPIDADELVFNDFTESDFKVLTDLVNENIEHGCCGGCI